MSDPAEQTTAAEWMFAHRAEQTAEDAYREVHNETDFADNDLHQLADIDHTPAPLLETSVADSSETFNPEPTPPRRGTVVYESAASVARARTVLAEIHAHEQYDQTREADEATRWAQPDHGAERADELVSEC